MHNIRKAIKDNIPLTNDEILQVFHEVGAQGDVILFKNDGLRETRRFTVVIMSPAGNFDSIRFDDITLTEALSGCLKRYFDVSQGDAGLIK